MTCSRCHKDFDDGVPRCPHCGERSTKASGLFQTSTVMISAEGADQVYRSVEEVPAPLRNRLLKSTNSPSSRTILIADLKGRREIGKAIRRLPGAAQRRLLRALLDAEAPSDPPRWLTTARRRWLSAIVLLMALAVVAVAFLYR